MAKSEAFDRLTELAAALFGAPIALITVLDQDRQWFRSNRGYDADQTTRDESFCAHMVGGPAGSTMVVEDATLDPRFQDNGLVTRDGVRFYAGAVITTVDGAQDGAVCVIDTVARPAPTAAQMESLALLAGLAGHEIDKARLMRRQSEQTAKLEMAEAMSGVGHWRYDVATRAIEWSDEVFRIHGLEPGSVDPTFQAMSPQYHPEDRAKVWALIERALVNGEGYDTLLRIDRAGEQRVTRTQAKAELDHEGQAIALFGVFQDITESVRGQERIKASESLFRLLSETATDIVARYAADGSFLYVSPSVEAILGRKPEEMIGRKWGDFTVPEDLPAVCAKVKAYLEAGSGADVTRYEYRALKADGTIVWLEASPRALRDADGRVFEMQDHVRDITARKVVEGEQAELVETLRMAENLAGLGSWKLNAVSGHVRWSEQVYRIHGVTPEAFDPNLDDAVGFYHPDDQQAVRDWCAKAIETGEAGEFQLRLRRSDGEERTVISQCRPVCGPDGTTIALYGVFQDVTERVQAEEAIKASEARYRLLADNSTDIIATYGIDGVFRYLSPAIEGPMGYRPDELVGQTCGYFMHPEDVDRVQAVFADYARRGPGTPSPRVPYRGVRKDGSFVWLEAHPKVIRDAKGQPIEFQDVVRDITETKALEEALIEARDVAEAGARAKSEFLANMSHELRTPLTSVIGFSGLLKGSQSLPDAERRFADRIATSSEALLSVINDILDYSKLEADAVGLDPMPFDPKAMAEGAAGIVEAQCVAKGLALDIEVEPGLPEALMGDEGRLRQVTLNFLSNAVKFTGSGRVLLKMGWADERLRIAVTDSGIGIAADKIDALFDRFTQADASTTRVYGGTGLGLAISRRLIELMGGQIGADSRPGHGSTFWLEVPLDAARIGATADAQTLAEVPAGSRILMADDAAANRELVRAILGGWDIVLETVDDGAAAVQAAASGAYDLILMDVHMPVMDGLDATRAIRAMSGQVSRTPILALTANVQPEQVAACRSAGMDGHVGKPIQIRDLMATIANQLTASNVEPSNVDAAA